MNILVSIGKKLFNFVATISLLAILFFVPLKILSYGWSPNYAMLITSTFTKSNDLPLSNEVIKESIKTQKKVYDLAKEENLVYFVTFSFVMFNIIGLCSTNNPIAWFAAMTLLMLTNGKFIIRILNCSPQLLLCMLLMIFIALFSESIKEKHKTSSFALLIYIFMLRSIVPPEV